MTAIWDSLLLGSVDPKIGSAPASERGPLLEDEIKNRRLGILSVSSLPLVADVHVEFRTSKRDKVKQRVWVAWPVAPGDAGAFLVLHRKASRSELSVVLPDWSNERTCLRLSRVALQEAGLPPDSLERCLSEAARTRSFRYPDVEARRFSVASDNQAITVSTEAVDGVEQRIGRIHAGWFEEGGTQGGRRVVVNVLMLPRLAPSPDPPLDPVRINGCPVIALGDRDCARAFLARTLLNRWRSERLLAMLSLAHDVPFDTQELPVPCSFDTQASALGFLPFLRALEDVSLDQRRAYHRYETEGRTLAGTLRLSPYFGRLAAGRPDRVPIARFALSLDTPENRVFLAVVLHVSARLRAAGDGLSRWIANRLDVVAQRFEHVAPIGLELAAIEALLNRPEMPDLQRTALERCRDVSVHRYASLDAAGDESLAGSGTELDLPSLFEASVRSFLMQALGLPVFGDQSAPRQEALRWLEPSNTPRLLPDIVVRGPRSVLAIGDAKYKKLVPSSGVDGMGQNASFWPLRREDFHQVMTYMLAWPEVKKAVVVYPDETSDDTTIGSCTRLVRELRIGEDRTVGVFAFSPERWKPNRSSAEKIRQWIEDR